MDLHAYLYLMRKHLQVQAGTVSRDAEVGTVSREAGVTAVAQHEQDDSSDEKHAEEGPQLFRDP